MNLRDSAFKAAFWLTLPIWILPFTVLYYLAPYVVKPKEKPPDPPVANVWDAGLHSSPKYWGIDTSNYVIRELHDELTKARAQLEYYRSKEAQTIQEDAKVSEPAKPTIEPISASQETPAEEPQTEPEVASPGAEPPNHEPAAQDHQVKQESSEEKLARLRVLVQRLEAEGKPIKAAELASALRDTPHWIGKRLVEMGYENTRQTQPDGSQPHVWIKKPATASTQAEDKRQAPKASGGDAATSGDDAAESGTESGNKAAKEADTSKS